MAKTKIVIVKHPARVVKPNVRIVEHPVRQVKIGKIVYRKEPIEGPVTKTAAKLGVVKKGW